MTFTRTSDNAPRFSARLPSCEWVWRFRDCERHERGGRVEQVTPHLSGSDRQVHIPLSTTSESIPRTPQRAVTLPTPTGEFKLERFLAVPDLPSRPENLWISRAVVDPSVWIRLQLLYRHAARYQFPKIASTNFHHAPQTLFPRPVQIPLALHPPRTMSRKDFISPLCLNAALTGVQEGKSGMRNDGYGGDLFLACRVCPHCPISLGASRADDGTLQ